MDLYKELERQNKLNKIYTNDTSLRLKLYDMHRNNQVNILNSNIMKKKLSKYSKDIKSFKIRYDNLIKSLIPIVSPALGVAGFEFLKSVCTQLRTAGKVRLPLYIAVILCFMCLGKVNSFISTILSYSFITCDMSSESNVSKLLFNLSSIE
mgnify:CR=1 FL=1